MVSGMSACVVTSAVMLLIKMAAVHGGTVVTANGAETFTIYPGIGRYIYYPGPSNWTNAHKVCVEAGGHLAIADSTEEADVLFDMIPTATSSPVYVHLGYHTRYQEGESLTVRGQPFSKSGYQNRTNATPLFGSDMNCGALYYTTTSYSSGIMLNSACERTLPYICEFRLWDDYELIPGFGYYKLHQGPRFWYEAEYTCRSEGGYLLIVNSAAERDAVLNKYAAVEPSGHVWYGAHQKFASQVYVTIFDEKIEDTGFSTWYTGFPGGVSSPYLALHFISGSNSNLELYPETEQFPFICKHDLHDLM